MILKLRYPQTFSEIGKKDNQEDFVWPLPAQVTAEQRIFILCDGIGGADKGEVASETAATAIGEYLTNNWPGNGIVTKALFQKALDAAYTALDKADSAISSPRKMGTTMACAIFHTEGVLVAHIGDSRVYHIRPLAKEAGEDNCGILHQTIDHSLVNELLRIGEITEEEVANHPRKNVITRAMQPGVEHPCKADIVNLTDVQPGDYFFICSDGILEHVTDARLTEIISDATLDETAKLAAIKAICDEGTRDNYTCWLIGVDSIAEGTSCQPPLPIAEVADEESASIKEMPTADETEEDPVEEQADEEIADVENDTQAIESELDRKAKDAKEDEETENNIELVPEEKEEEEWDEDDMPEGFMGVLYRTKYKARRFGKKVYARTRTFLTTSKERIMQTRAYNRIMATNRWHWILGTIAFLTLYDLTLLLFGDTSYNIIFPKAEPLDSVLIEEKPKLIQPEIEEYQAPKPDTEKADDKEKKEKEETESTNEGLVEETMPTSVNTEVAPVTTAPKINEIPKPVIAPAAPSAPTGEGGN